MCISNKRRRERIDNGRKEETTDREEISADETRPSSLSIYMCVWFLSLLSVKRCEEAQRRACLEMKICSVFCCR